MRAVACTLLVILSTAVAHNEPHYVPGHDGMVHLFEWKWLDIGLECTRFLGPMGFGGVQVRYSRESDIRRKSLMNLKEFCVIRYAANF